ncbi:serine hydrolase domain-containing protein [Dactylosporangium matsuzakiense]|uniref:Esterase n=1 Tax=Dactylosporangium matsuzakiense TaxID=53360 RepID=A0A9W6KJR7_9ACTN|nr:serine hydrolase domain-containing protein [Dactylosporangium matsuzakiense]GLL02115.1 esterase [Dactylosporangium matsuzakiense]
MKVEGHVTVGFEPVADEVARIAGDGLESGGALAVHLDGRPVVDVWFGQAGPSRLWDADTACVMLSASKAIIVLCAQILVERGVLDLEAPVAAYWPEFAAAGKSRVLVRHVLTHTAGVLTFPRYWDVIGPDGMELADWPAVTQRLAAAPASWPPGTAFQYTPLTFGYLMGELIRRSDGRSIGQFVADELAGPLGLHLWIGVPDKVQERVARLVPEAPAENIRWARLQERTDHRARELVRRGHELHPDAGPYAGVFLGPEQTGSTGHLARLMNDPRLREAEIPACNAISTARSVSRLYAALSLDGALDGVRLVSADSIEQFVDPEPSPGSAPSGFGLGYMKLPMITLARPGELSVRPSEGTFGHSGAGGALAFADRSNRLAFAYLKNRMLRFPTPTYDLVRAVYRCLGSR